MSELKNKSDESLVSMYVDGSNEAFDVLIERHKNRVYTYILHSVKDPELANDIFQETFVKAIVTINQGRYTENGHFPAWITRIAHNLIIDYFRQDKINGVKATSTASSSDVDIFNRRELCDSTIEEHLISAQIQKDVRRLIKALPKSQRDVLLMRYYKNMSFKEIAMRTNVSINTALGRMRYAILNMRRLAQQHNIALTM